MSRNTGDGAKMSIRLEIQNRGMVKYKTRFLPILSASLPKGIAHTIDASADPVTIAPKMNSLAPLIEWAKTCV